MTQSEVQMKIYRFNEYEWVAAPNWPAAIRWYFKETGVRIEDGLDEDAYELSDEDMDAYKYLDIEGEFGAEGESYTFRDALEKILERRRELATVSGVKPDDPNEPFVFAGTEF